MKGWGFWRTSLVAVAVIAVVWLCAIVYWRSAGVVPSGGQMLLVLGVLPAGALLTLWGVRRLRHARRERAAKAEAAAAPAAADAAAIDVAPPRPPVEVLAGGLRLRCGDSPAAVLAALAAPSRPPLHPQLRDRDGLPVFAAYVEDLHTEVVADALPQSVREGEAAADDASLRALALLEPVASELLETVVRLLPPLPVIEERVIAGLRRREAQELRIAVRVSLLLPSRWPQPLRQAGGDWLLQLAQAAGLDAQRCSFDVAAAADADAVWRRIDGVADTASDSKVWHLLLACDSWIGADAVQRLLAAGRLMDSRRTEGLVPGEAAAGVLLRPQAAPAAAEAAQALLHRVGRRSLEVGAQPKAAARAGGQLLTRTLEPCGVTPEAVAFVLSDADQRPSRAAEAAAAASAACPELDTATQYASLGVACGHVGHVAPLLLVALAAARVADARQPVLALAVADERERASVALTPAPEAGAEAASEPTSPHHQAGAAPGLAA